MQDKIDDLDLAILRLLAIEPKIGIREYARKLGVARGTVHARIEKLQRMDVVTDYAPQISPSGLGFAGLAYVYLNIAQGSLEETIRRLGDIPQIIEAYSIAGEGDLICQVVAKNNADLESVIHQMLLVPGVIRSRSEVVLRRKIEPRIVPLINMLAAELDPGGGVVCTARVPENLAHIKGARKHEHRAEQAAQHHRQRPRRHAQA